MIGQLNDLKEGMCESTLKLCKEMKDKEPTMGELKIAIDDAIAHGFKKRSKVKFIHSETIGTIVGFNDCISGFYPGTRYPLIVTSTRGKHPYALTDLTLEK